MSVLVKTLPPDSVLRSSVTALPVNRIAAAGPAGQSGQLLMSAYSGQSCRDSLLEPSQESVAHRGEAVDGGDGQPSPDAGEVAEDLLKQCRTRPNTMRAAPEPC